MSEYFPRQKHLKIADIGTGAGFLAISYAQLGHNVTATDVSPLMLEEARRNALARGVEVQFILDNAESTTLPRDEFDLVILRDVLSNIQQWENTLQLLITLLRPGGLLMISDGNYFLHLHDEKYSRRKAYFTLKDGSPEYQKMIQLSQEQYFRLESIVGDLEVNKIKRPHAEGEFLMKIGMNNLRMRCDDRQLFTILGTKGKEKVPFRYTLTAMKPYLDQQISFNPGMQSKSFFYSNKLESFQNLGFAFEALGNAERVKILVCLNNGKMNVGTISDTTGIPVKNVSYHLKILSDAGFVKSSKTGREVFYSQTDYAAIEVVLHTISELIFHR